MPLTACQSPPISTSSLLTYLTCVPLVPSARERIDWLALVGVFGDLGSNEIRFGDAKGGWPVTKEMSHLGVALKREGRKNISDAVSLLNARKSPSIKQGKLKDSPRNIEQLAEPQSSMVGLACHVG